MSFTCIFSSAAGNFVCTYGLPFRDRHKTVLIETLKLPPLAVPWNLPSPAPSGPKFHGHVFTEAPLFRGIIFAHSNRCGLAHSTENVPAQLTPSSSHPPRPDNHAPVIITFVITPGIIKPRIVGARMVCVTRMCRFLCFLT